MTQSICCILERWSHCRISFSTRCNRRSHRLHHTSCCFFSCFSDTSRHSLRFSSSASRNHVDQHLHKLYPLQSLRDRRCHRNVCVRHNSRVWIPALFDHPAMELSSLLLLPVSTLARQDYADVARQCSVTCVTKCAVFSVAPATLRNVTSNCNLANLHRTFYWRTNLR